MKIRMMCALAGVGGAMICCGETEAAYLGLGVRLHTTMSLSGAGGGLKDVYRVFAVFSDANDYVTAVGGSVANGPATIKTVLGIGGLGGNFYNPISGGNTAPVSESGSFSPALKQWDTFATIGVASVDIAAGEVDATQLTAGFPTFISGNAWNQADASWFTDGPVEQGRAGGGANGNHTGQFKNFGFDGPNGMGVLIAQLTTIAGQGISGTIFVAGVNAGAQPTEFTAMNQAFGSFLPGPGAVVVFGAAGMVGTRRRRGR